MGKNYYFNKEQDTALVASVLFGDLIILNALYIAISMWRGYAFASISVCQTMLVASLVYLLCNIHNGVVLYKRTVNNIKIALRVLRNMTVFTVVSYLLIRFGMFNRMHTVYLLLWYVATYFCVLAFRLTVRYFVKQNRKKAKNMRRTVFVGSYNNVLALYEEMTASQYVGYKVIGYFDDEPTGAFPPECKYLGKPSEAIAYMETNKNVDELYCCLPSARKDEILPIIHFCLSNCVHFFSVPNVSIYLRHRVSLNLFGRVPYFSLYREPLSKPGNRFIKRVFDVVFSLAFLCTIFPFMYIIVAIITKITMPGPVFFKQKRSGLNGKEFYFYKFRSMKVNADADTLQATKDDPRKTKWGNIMRKTSLDEFPQFINVLLGQMSIVGPRPHMVKQTEDYSRMIDNYMVRHYVKPGITGWSQVTGFRGETKKLSQMEERVNHDIWYIEHWSLPLDCYIIYRTVVNLFTGDKNAY